MSFEQSIKRLDDIVKTLQNGNINLDESLKLFEEGASLIRECNEILDNAEQKINKLNLDGSMEEFISE